MPTLTWLTRDSDLKKAKQANFRILEKVSELSVTSTPLSDRTFSQQENLIIQGDNLEALKAFLPIYAGKVKCIYIDPPYNTRSAFEHYDDNMEHSLWLSMMVPRLELLKDLLAEDGSIWVSIDDNELGYLIVAMDEIFGRRNRIALTTFKQSSVSGPKAINPGVVSIASYIIHYVKNKQKWMSNKIYVSRDRDDRYSKFIINVDDAFDKWKFTSLKKAFADSLGITEKAIKTELKEDFEDKIHEFVLKNSNRVVRTARVAPKDISSEARDFLEKSKEHRNIVFRYERQEKDNQYFLNGEQLIFYLNKTKIIDGEIKTAEALTNIWDDLLSNNLHNEGGIHFPDGKKPEALIKRIFEICTNENDLVLDSFLGSGTTAAVAHKMGRRYIGIEIGEHAVTHIVPRLRKVIEGEQGGISEAVGWKGGGGFSFYRLGETIFNLYGAINPKIKFPALAQYIWFMETGMSLSIVETHSTTSETHSRASLQTPLIGIHNDTAYYLLYNGILGDKSPAGGNALTRTLLAELRPFEGKKIIFGESCRISPDKLKDLQITFKQIPYDLKVK
jgi:adenine-specific DNA-methyltransferase